MWPEEKRRGAPWRSFTRWAQNGSVARGYRSLPTATYAENRPKVFASGGGRPILDRRRLPAICANAAENAAGLKAKQILGRKTVRIDDGPIT